MERVVIYGAGIRGSRLCDILQDTDIEIVAVLDSDSLKWGTFVEGYPIYPPQKIQEFPDANLCIAIESQAIIEAIRRDLEAKYNYDLKKEALYLEVIFEAYLRKRYLEEKVRNVTVRTNKEERILFDCFNGLILGGVEAWTMNVCEELIKRDYKNVYIISANGKYNIPQRISNSIIYTDIYKQNRFYESSVQNIIDVIIKNLPCRVITSQIDEVMLAAVLVKRAYPELVDIISVIHNGDERIYESYIRISKYVDVFIGVSQEIRKNMIARGFDSNRIYDMTCPFYCEKEILRTYTEDKSAPIRIGYAGRMDKVGIIQKRMDLLLQFAKKLDGQNVNYIFELAGDGPARQEMEEFVDTNNLQNRVQFLGILDREEIPRFWKNQDIFVNFSDFEGRCISKLEAMANGAVPITTNTAGTREDIEDGVNGFVVPIGDYNTMVDRVTYLEQHRDKLKEMGMLAHDRIYPKSLMDKHIDFWEEILKLK